MLTVWRKLHIEVDSIGSVPSSINDPNVNKVRGAITGLGQVPCPAGTCTTYVISINNGSNYEEHRFQSGRIRFLTSGNSYSILDNGFNQNANSQIVILNGNPQGSVNVAAGDEFDLFDDDDFDDDDGTSLDGDANESLIPPIPISNTSSTLIHPSDAPCSSSTTSNCNILAPAYIRPIYDLANPNPTTPFILNLPMSVDVLAGPANPPDIQAAFRFDNVAYSDRDDIWVVYLSSAYQIDERWDGDPNGERVVLGITDSLVGSGQGALLFLETTRPSEAGTNWNNGPISRNYTVAHELGHKFGGIHNDLGLMADSRCRTTGTFEAITLNRMRGGLVNGSRLTHP